MQIVSLIVSAAALVSSVSAILVNTVYYIDQIGNCGVFAEVGASQPAGKVCLYIQYPSMNVTFNGFAPYYLMNTYTWFGKSTQTPPPVGTAYKLLATNYPAQTVSSGLAYIANQMYPYAAIEYITAPTDTCGQQFKAVSYVNFGLPAVLSSTGNVLSKARTVMLSNTLPFTVQCVAVQPPPVVV